MKYQDIYNCICRNTKKWRYTIHYVKPTAQLLFKKIDFQKVDQHAGAKWLIHDTKRRKDYQLQSHDIFVVRLTSLSDDTQNRGPLCLELTQGK